MLDGQRSSSSGQDDLAKVSFSPFFFFVEDDKEPEQGKIELKKNFVRDRLFTLHIHESARVSITDRDSELWQMARIDYFLPKNISICC